MVCVLVVKSDSILGQIRKTLHFGDEDGHLKKFTHNVKCIFKRYTRKVKCFCCGYTGQKAKDRRCNGSDDATIEQRDSDALRPT